MYQLKKKYTKKSLGRRVRATNNSNNNIETNRKTQKPRKPKWGEKQMYGYFKRKTGEIEHKKPNIGQKTNFVRSTESLLIAEQNNAIITNVKTYNT